MSFDSFEEDNSKSAKERILSRKNSNVIEKMKDIWDFTKKKLASAQDTQKRYVDQRRTSSSEYKLEDTMWLFTRNIKTERLSRKLNHKWIESYKIKKILRDACQLNLSQSMKIHDIFYTFLLRKAATNPLTRQIQLSSLSVVMNDEEEYEINNILNSRYHYDKLQYKVV
jgi:hypothetical protein